MKLACVIQRYGVEVAGGSETHCRQLAERLAIAHDVTVLTSCARDHLVWRNEYPPGPASIGGVRVIRFPVARERHLHRFAEASDLAFSGRATDDEERQWFAENGPGVPGLLAHLQSAGRSYDGVIFWTYRYAPSSFGLPLVRDRAILVPTAEDDPAVRMRILAEYFAMPRGYLFLTPEEQELVASWCGGPLPPSVVIGGGLDPAVPPPGPEILAAAGVQRPYVLYLGRIERNKGCEVLLRHYLRHAARAPDTPPLVLAGPAAMELPSHPRIRPLGYVSDEQRQALLAHAAVLVVPSVYESLSMVLLEAWNYGVPALVNARCRVTRGQVQRANGGLYYWNGTEFSDALQYLTTLPADAAQLGRQGLAYVEREYRWPRVMQKVEDFLRAVLPGPARVAVGLPSGSGSARL